MGRLISGRAGRVARGKTQVDQRSAVFPWPEEPEQNAAEWRRGLKIESARGRIDDGSAGKATPRTRTAPICRPGRRNWDASYRKRKKPPFNEPGLRFLLEHRWLESEMSFRGKTQSAGERDDEWVFLCCGDCREDSFGLSPRDGLSELRNVSRDFTEISSNPGPRRDAN